MGTSTPQRARLVCDGSGAGLVGAAGLRDLCTLLRYRVAGELGGDAVTEADARKLCEQAGAPLPTGMHAGSFEKVRNARRKIVDGIGFRSTLEANVYQLLKSWEKVGEIRNLICQPKYVLQAGFRAENGRRVRAVEYIADFQFERARRLESSPDRVQWRTVVVDAKGFRMEVYRLKAKLFQATFPHIVFEEWTKETLRAAGG